MYKPPDAITSVQPHEVIALIGAPGAGKTSSAQTFPNRVWYDFDHKLPLNEISIPMWDGEYVAKLITRKQFAGDPPNRRDAFLKHLRENHDKFTPEQTLILDSWSLMQNAIDQQTELEESRMEKPNPFAFWKRKAAYSIQIMEMLKACKCRVVVTFHETIERNEDGDATGKLRPVMDGSFKDQLLGHFTDVWRQLSAPIERDSNGRELIKDGKKVIKQELVNGNQWQWYWQLLGDNQVNTNTNPVLGQKIRKHGIKMVRADYNEIQRIYNLE